MTSTQRVVVVGGGMAGARLTQQLAAADDVDLTVVGEETHAAYNRVLLAEVLAGRYPAEVVALPAPPPRTRWLSGVRAVRVDRAERLVVCDDGAALPYDALVLATGSNPVLPPLRGLFGPERTIGQALGRTAAQEGPEEQTGAGVRRARTGARTSAPGDGLPEGVRAFRTMDDCLALERELRPGVRAVVVGGGLLGVSAARALARRGAQVVLTHQGEHLMERQLDPGASELLRDHLGQLGVEVHTECRARGLLTRPAKRTGGGPAHATRAVRAVTLADGYELAADIVVLACGVRPRTGLAQAAGLALGSGAGRGIVVDDQLRTSDPHIYAIGDCAEHDGVLYGLAGAAQEQADTLARVLTANAPATGAAPAPVAPRYRGTRALTRLTLAGDPQGLPLDLAAFGETDPLPDDDVVRLADATRGRYRKVVVRGDRLVGGILLGDLGTVGALARTWEGDEPLPSAPLLHLLTNDGGS
ncbi:NAD(P)/FAD-dependent oxidoreductase [Streptomyces daliensis]|uniref:NAD(P)/FAD-dependent oxidoreductase n=1 Tax=Streptomyces daliensis TaxID=299421 RepID=A0A8T4IUM8_9ACTN|nr:NAD(P)/FAD-dependent oxidoreductase [Streptomyces daliensis]